MRLLATLWMLLNAPVSGKSPRQDAVETRQTGHDPSPRPPNLRVVTKTVHRTCPTTTVTLPSYGWISTNGTTIPYSFPSTATPASSLGSQSPVFTPRTASPRYGSSGTGEESSQEGSSTISSLLAPSDPSLVVISSTKPFGYASGRGAFTLLTAVATATLGSMATRSSSDIRTTITGDGETSLPTLVSIDSAPKIHECRARPLLSPATAYSYQI